MHSKQPLQNLLSRAATAALALVIMFALAVVLSPAAQAQTYKVLYNFTGGLDGGTPFAGLTMDKAGNLYGTTRGFPGGYGTVYRLRFLGSSWVFNPLYTFTGGKDGAKPYAGVIFGPNGSLYGTTSVGGNLTCNQPSGCGTVFNLRPQPTVCLTSVCAWTETVLYAFKAGADGAYPEFGDLTFDQAGNIYGTTGQGGNSNRGTVYELTPSNGGWTESIIYSFTGGADGAYPNAGFILDNAGNLYGTAYAGGSSNLGTVFQLTYSVGSGWTENVLYSFGYTGGDQPYAGLIFDQSGNLYGATSDGGSGDGGTVFELTPGENGNWTYTLIYSFDGTRNNACGPRNLVLDGAGNIYGATRCDGSKYDHAGSVFKLTPTPAPPWTYTSLHDFTDGDDGGYPISNVVIDANGNLYGTASNGGSYGAGVVWEITP